MPDDPTVLVSARVAVTLSDAFRAVAASRGRSLSEELRAAIDHVVIEAADSINERVPAGQGEHATAASNGTTEAKVAR